MTVADTTTVVETEQHAMRRLLAKARAEGVKLGRDAKGRYWAASTSTPGLWYALTAVSCTYKGFAGHQRCKHLAALHAHLGWLNEDRDLETEPTKAPVIEFRHTEGAWVDDSLTPADMVRWVKTRTSLLIDGREEVRVTGDDGKVSAVFRPGTESAKDLHTCSTHYATVVHFARMLDPEGYERALAAAEMFPADEFLEEATLVAA
jgi:hypothetical protein